MRTANLRDRLSVVCYQHIQPHIARYNAEPDLGNCLPLMEPHIFGEFAERVLTDVVGLVGEYVRVDSRSLRAELARCLHDFAGALNQYAGEFDFVQRRPSRLPHSDRRHRVVRSESEEDYLGGWMNGIVTAVNGFYHGNTYEQQYQANGERLQQAFNAMLQAYDQAMGVLVETVLSLLGG